jgi:hypothetical protein
MSNDALKVKCSLGGTYACKSDVLAMVTHLIERDKACKPLHMVLIVIVPDLMTLQRYPADMSTGVADAATIIICGVDEGAQVIPISASHLVAQVAIPAWPGNKLNGESHVDLFLPFKALHRRDLASMRDLLTTGYYVSAFHESIQPYA